MFLLFVSRLISGCFLCTPIHVGLQLVTVGRQSIAKQRCAYLMSIAVCAHAVLVHKFDRSTHRFALLFTLHYSHIIWVNTSVYIINILYPSIIRLTRV